MATFADDFNRANGAVGANWTTIPGGTTPQIASNAVSAINVATQYGAIIATTTADFGDDQAITVTLTRGTASSQIQGVYVRLNTATVNGYTFYLQSNGTAALLQRVDAGVATTIDTAAVTGGGTFTLSAIGDQITVSQDGVGVILEATDTNHPTGGQPGIIVFRSGSGSGGSIDDVSATDEFAGSVEGTGSSTGAAGTGIATGLRSVHGTAASTGPGGTGTATGAKVVYGVASSTGAGGSGVATGEGSSTVTGTGVSVGAAGTGSAAGAKVVHGSGASTGPGGTGTGTGAKVVYGTAVSVGPEGNGHGSGDTIPGGGEPLAPTEVRPTGAFGWGGEVELTWTVPDDNGSSITGYVVQVSTNDGDTWTTHATPAGTPATITGLAINQRYIFRVAAVNANGVGVYGVSEWGATPVLPDDPITPPSATTRDASHSGRWGIDEIDGTTDNLATSTWTGDGVRVYIVDSNFRLTHDEFDNQAFADGYAIDGLTLGSLAFGEDHGTKIAAVAVGLTVGVAYDAIMIPVASHNQSVTTPIFNFVEALQWVYDHHTPGIPAIVITSNLWGDDGGNPAFTDTDGRQTSEWFPLLDQLVTDLIEDKGMAFVQCIGNSTSTAHIDLAARPGLVLVSYSNESNQYASGSEFSPDTTIIAPGASILTAQSTGDSSYVLQSGTSFAAPMTGGAMACWLEANPNLSPRQLVDILLATSAKDVLSNETGGAPNRELRSLADIGLLVATGVASSVGAAGAGSATGTRSVFATASSVGAGGTGTAAAQKVVSGIASSVGAAGTGAAVGSKVVSGVASSTGEAGAGTAAGATTIVGSGSSTGEPGDGTASGSKVVHAVASSIGDAGTGSATGSKVVSGVASSTGAAGSGFALGTTTGSAVGTGTSVGAPGDGTAVGSKVVHATAASTGDAGTGTASGTRTVSGVADSTGEPGTGTAVGEGVTGITGTGLSVGAPGTGTASGLRRVFGAASSITAGGIGTAVGQRRCMGVGSSTGAAGTGFCTGRRKVYGVASSTGGPGYGVAESGVTTIATVTLSDRSPTLDLSDRSWTVELSNA